MHTVTSKDGTKITYDKSGQGPALILASGAFSYRKFPQLVQLANLLSANFTVYNYDRRGRGDSGDTQPYAVEREIEDLEALIAEAGGSAYVWGLSSGAVLALRAAASGLNIAKLALHEPPFVVHPEDRRPPANFAAHVTQLIAEGRRADAVKFFMTKVIGAPAFVPYLLRIIPGAWSSLIQLAHTLPYDAAILDGHMDGKPLAAEPWQHVAMPVLVLEGPESPALLHHAARDLVRVLPNARLLSRKGLGHTKKLAPELIAQALTAFFGDGEANG
jgi:pimeloyl-ACP methyl ester carboxylesterase